MTLYHDKLVPVGVHCLMAAVAAIAADCAAETPQEARCGAVSDRHFAPVLDHEELRGAATNLEAPDSHPGNTG